MSGELTAIGLTLLAIVLGALGFYKKGSEDKEQELENKELKREQEVREKADEAAKNAASVSTDDKRDWLRDNKKRN